MADDRHPSEGLTHLTGPACISTPSLIGPSGNGAATPARRRFLRALLYSSCLPWLTIASSPPAGAQKRPPRSETVRTDNVLLLDAAAVERRIVAVGERGYVLISDDGGKTWQRSQAPAQATLTAVYFLDASLGWAAGHDGVILGTRDGGRSWKSLRHSPQDDGPLLDIWFANPHDGIVTGAYGAYLETFDGGVTWHRRAITESDSHLYAITRTGKGGLIAAGESGTLYRSGDGGKIWQALSSPYRGSLFGALSLQDGGVLVFGLRGHVYRSGDDGRTWNEIPTGVQTALMGGAVGEDGSIALVGHDGVVLISSDGGRTFSRKRSDRNAFSSAVFTAGGDLLLFGEKGISSMTAAEQRHPSG